MARRHAVYGAACLALAMGVLACTLVLDTADVVMPPTLNVSMFFDGREFDTCEFEAFIGKDILTGDRCLFSCSDKPLVLELDGTESVGISAIEWSTEDEYEGYELVNIEADSGGGLEQKATMNLGVCLDTELDDPLDVLEELGIPVTVVDKERLSLTANVELVATANDAALTARRAVNLSMTIYRPGNPIDRVRPSRAKICPSPPSQPPKPSCPELTAARAGRRGGPPQP